MDHPAPIGSKAWSRLGYGGGIVDEAAVLGESERQLLVEQVHRHTGIVVDAGKLDMALAKAWPKLEAAGLHSVQLLPKALAESPLAQQFWHALIPAITINETYFRREAKQLDAFAKEVLPDLKRKATQEGRSVQLLSAACATGEEAYGLAQLLWEIGGGEVLGVDIDLDALQVAQRGIYGPNSLRGVDESWRERMLVPIGPAQWAPQPHLRELVGFRQVNLLNARHELGDRRFDAIFCRNVLIYFDRPTQLAVLLQLRDLLRPDGCLFLGHSEIFFEHELNMDVVIDEHAHWFCKRALRP